MDQHVVVRLAVTVDAPIERVWERVTSPAGINDELAPILSMGMPRDYRDATVATVPVGVPLGKAWLRLGGIVPVDYDDLMIVELDPPHGFHERSTMLAARTWEHRRRLARIGETKTHVTDELTIEPRLPVPARVPRMIVTSLFKHRHRRLAAHFAAAENGRVT
ncbi:hypothetical protein BHE97_02805 [Aeromicrobium sp. PE09-221]|uniref:hypothetical protein n=1 Tax=Aeromicrobium sp. PE09-221 TaxID=1898043 RepID=UPI000B3ED2F1|nr:hypothetical protein [Aeromicrobium sp. PE09-221]OUZ12140.1 hypothetical protein BHE97_02805 [Aeromicrobium sp. PE09-221]